MHGSTAVRLLGLRVRIPPGAWMSVSCECCVLSDRGLCDGSITRPEESYRVWRSRVIAIEQPRRGFLGQLGLLSHDKKNSLTYSLIVWYSGPPPSRSL